MHRLAHSKVHTAPLQVQSLHRATVLLRLHDALPGSTEILHLHSHPTLAQRHQTGFRANRSNIGSGEIVLLVDELVQIHVVTEGHLRRVESEDLLLGVF